MLTLARSEEKLCGVEFRERADSSKIAEKAYKKRQQSVEKCQKMTKTKWRKIPT